MIELGIKIGVIVLVSIVLILIPARAWASILKPISFNKFGIRYIRRRRDNTDSLGNWMMFISFILSIVFVFIPYFPIVIGVWLTFAFLATLGQGARVATTLSGFKGKMVMLGICLMYGCGLAASTGLLSNFAIVSDVAFFKEALFNNELLNLLYYLDEPYAADLLLEFVLIFMSSYVLWAQFKYLRLEDTFKARWIVTYLFKILIVCTILFGLGNYGFSFIDTSYNVVEATV